MASPQISLAYGALLEEQQLISELTASAELNIAPHLLARYRKAGLAPRHIQLGDRILYRRDDLRTWLTEGPPELPRRRKRPKLTLLPAPA